MTIPSHSNFTLQHLTTTNTPPPFSHHFTTTKNYDLHTKILSQINNYYNNTTITTLTGWWRSKGGATNCHNNNKLNETAAFISSLRLQFFQFNAFLTTFLFWPKILIRLSAFYLFPHFPHLFFFLFIFSIFISFPDFIHFICNFPFLLPIFSFNFFN